MAENVPVIKEGANRPEFFAMHQLYLDGDFAEVQTRALALFGRDRKGGAEDVELLDMALRACLKSGQEITPEVLELARGYASRVSSCLLALLETWEADSIVSDNSQHTPPSPSAPPSSSPPPLRPSSPLSNLSKPSSPPSHAIPLFSPTSHGSPNSSPTLSRYCMTCLSNGHCKERKQKSRRRWTGSA